MAARVSHRSRDGVGVCRRVLRQAPPDGIAEVHGASHGKAPGVVVVPQAQESGLAVGGPAVADAQNPAAVRRAVGPRQVGGIGQVDGAHLSACRRVGAGVIPHIAVESKIRRLLGRKLAEGVAVELVVGHGGIVPEKTPTPFDTRLCPVCQQVNNFFEPMGPERCITTVRGAVLKQSNSRRKT